MKKSKALYIGVLMAMMAAATIDHVNAFLHTNPAVSEAFMANANGPNFNLVASLKE